MILRCDAFLVVAFCCFACPLACCQSAPHGVIIPGESVAGLKLGAPLVEFKAVFPKDPTLPDDVLGDPCDNRIYQWVDVPDGATGVYAYLKGDKIFQLSVQTPRFSLSNGIKYGDSDDRVKRLYRNGREYVLLNSRSLSLGPRDLHYWVDQGGGIAFGFYWNQERKQRMLMSIDVFGKGTTFQPDSCVSPPRGWELLRRPHESH